MKLLLNTYLTNKGRILKDTLKRMLGMTSAAAPVADTQKEEVTMDNNEDTSPELAAVLAQDVAGLQATIASLTVSLATANAEVAELKDLVAQATAFQENQLKLAAEAKSASRLSQLTSVLGDAEAATLNASLASLSDEAFSGVVHSLGVKSKAEAATPLFNEVGVDGEVDSTKLADDVKSNGVMHILTAKYPK